MSASIDDVGLDGTVKSSKVKAVKKEFVEDNKEGILPPVNKIMVACQSVSNIDDDGHALVRHLHPYRLVGGSSFDAVIQADLIDIYDDVNI